jgi:hypothetical protein
MISHRRPSNCCAAKGARRQVRKGSLAGHWTEQLPRGVPIILTHALQLDGSTQSLRRRGHAAKVEQ